MVSDKIKTLKTTLSLAEAGGLKADGALLRIVQRQLSDIHAQVLALESAQMPAAALLTAADLASGKVVRLGRAGGRP